MRTVQVLGDTAKVPSMFEPFAFSAKVPSMSRCARLDVLDLVQHVMARGIDGATIFRNDKDRGEFLLRRGQRAAKAPLET